MKRLIALLLVVVTTASNAAPLLPLPLPLPPGVPGIPDSAFELSRVRIADAVEVMYTQVLKTPYLIQPDVVGD